MRVERLVKTDLGSADDRAVSASLCLISSRVCRLTKFVISRWVSGVIRSGQLACFWDSVVESLATSRLQKRTWTLIFGMLVLEILSLHF